MFHVFGVLWVTKENTNFIIKSFLGRGFNAHVKQVLRDLISNLPIMFSSTTFNCYHHNIKKIISQNSQSPNFPYSHFTLIKSLLKILPTQWTFFLNTKILAIHRKQLISCDNISVEISYRNSISIEMLSSLQLNLVISTSGSRLHLWRFDAWNDGRQISLEGKAKRLKSNFTDKAISVNITKGKFEFYENFPFQNRKCLLSAPLFF